jgi:hypothetical protein
MEPSVYLGVDIGRTSDYALAVDTAGNATYRTRGE